VWCQDRNSGLVGDGGVGGFAVVDEFGEGGGDGDAELEPVGFFLEEHLEVEGLEQLHLVPGGGVGEDVAEEAEVVARFPYLIVVLPQVAVRREAAMWRVFWVPQDAVRAGVRRRVLAGWDDLPGREDAAGVQAGDPIFLSPDYGVDSLLGLYVQSAAFRKYTAETKRNYATDIALLLTFLWGRGRAWTDIAERDLEDYEHWRRFAPGNPDRIGGAK
jgi:hypothetical protein